MREDEERKQGEEFEREEKLHQRRMEENEREQAASPGFGCRIRTEPVSNPNPNLRRRIRSESEPGPAEPIRIRTWQGRNRSESELKKKPNANPESGPKPRHTRAICTVARSLHHACRDAGIAVSPEARFLPPSWLIHYYISASAIQPQHPTVEQHRCVTAF